MHVTHSGKSFRLILKDCLLSICPLYTQSLLSNTTLLCWNIHTYYRPITWKKSCLKFWTHMTLFVSYSCHMCGEKKIWFSLQQLVGISAKQQVDILQCLKVTLIDESVNLTYLTQSPNRLCDHTATNPEKLLSKSGDGCFLPEFWRAHNGLGGWIKGTWDLFRLMRGALSMRGGEHSWWQRS